MARVTIFGASRAVRRHKFEITSLSFALILLTDTLVARLSLSIIVVGITCHMTSAPSLATGRMVMVTKSCTTTTLTGGRPRVSHATRRMQACLQNSAVPCVVSTEPQVEPKPTVYITVCKLAAFRALMCAQCSAKSMRNQSVPRPLRACCCRPVQRT
jgi:hypothetical protein